MVKCQECGSENPNEAIYCEQCGKKLSDLKESKPIKPKESKKDISEALVKCKNCGLVNRPRDTCIKCGHPLGEKTVEVEPEPKKEKLDYEDENIKIKGTSLLRPYALPIIIFILLLGVYGSYYAYAVTTLQGEDLKVFEEDRWEIKKFQFDENYIKGLEDLANQVETNSLLTQISESDRNRISDSIRINSWNSSSFTLRDKIKQNQKIALRYDVIGKRNVASDIRNAYSDELINTLNEIENWQGKVAEDLKNADNKKFAEDLRNYVREARKFNNLTANSEYSLSNIVMKLD